VSGGQTKLLQCHALEGRRRGKRRSGCLVGVLPRGKAESSVTRTRGKGETVADQVKNRKELWKGLGKAKGEKNHPRGKKDLSHNKRDGR